MAQSQRYPNRGGSSNNSKNGSGGEPKLIRPLLLPGILGSIVSLAGIALLAGDAILVVNYAIAILALITAWLSVQHKVWWPVVPLAAVAVVWNPIWPLSFETIMWQGLAIAASAIFIIVAVTVKAPDPH